MFYHKRLFCLIFCCLILCYSSITWARPLPSTIVIDALNGKILSAQNPDTIRYPASLTKLMTLYITFEAIEQGLLTFDDELPVSNTAANRSPSRLGLTAGDKIKVKTAIDALIVKSANDCATVLAEGLGYTETQFAEKMTEVAQTLGMKNTIFKNASGLPNKKQVTTARDMITLAAALYYHFPQYYDLFAQQKFTYNGKTYYSHNHILKNFEGADGMKTGYIAAAGFNIITSAWRDGDRVIAVAMGYDSQNERDQAVSRLMEKGFAKLAAHKFNQPTPTYAKLSSQDFQLTLHEKIQNPPIDKKASEFSKGTWQVQIGAFSNYAKARVYAQKIRRKYQHLNNSHVKVAPIEKDFVIVYQSQLVFLTEDDAQNICKDLQKENKSCIVRLMNKNQKLAMAEENKNE